MTLREKINAFRDITEKMHRIDFSTGAALYCVTWEGKPYQAKNPYALVRAVMKDMGDA